MTLPGPEHTAQTTSGQASGGDRQARVRALDPAESFIVQAPAGSGKTELLSQRVLALLATVKAPEAVVAITFTRKAAAEMRQRILGYLADPTPPSADAAEHENITRRLAAAARAQDLAQGWRLLETPQRLRIQTIDGFCGALVRRSPVLSAAGGGLGIRDEARNLHRQAARQVLALRDRDDASGDALRRVLLHFDHNSEKLVEMLASLLARRDAWRSATVGAEGEADRAALEAVLHALIADRVHSLRSMLGAERLQRWWQAACHAAQNLPEDRALQEAVAAGRLPETAAEASHWAALCQLLITAKGEIRKAGGINKTLGFPKKDAHKAALQALVEDLASLPGAGALLQELAELPPASYEAGQWRILEDLLACFRRAAAALQEHFAATGEVDHTEITLRALEALGSEDAPSELLLKLDHRIEHLLVDEFQDTSDMQHELLRKLTAGWAPGDGRTVFLVGDPMQSIYRFRAANVGLFLRCAAQGLGHLPLTRLRLEANFRSQQGIVDWVNACFARVLGGRDDLQTGRIAYSPSQAARPPLEGEAVRWHFCDGAAEEAERVAAICAAVPAGETAAVLLRSRGQAAAVLQALRRAGLRPAAVDMDPILKRPVVQDLHSLTRALSAPNDRLAWLALLRAPWCGLELKTLQRLCEDLPPGAPLSAQLQPVLERGRLAADEAERLRRVLPVLSRALARRGRLPLAELVEGVWLDLGGPACSPAPAALLDADAYLETLASVSQGAAWVDSEALIEALEQLRAASDPAADGALQVMTMHKAKGLQFDHVLLPGLSRGTRADERPAVAQSTVIIGDHELPLIAPLPPGRGAADPLFRLVHHRLEGQRSEAETGRLLYVAATRAVRRLHLLARPEHDKRGEPSPGRGLLRSLWPGVRDTVVPALRARAEHGPSQAGTVASPEPAPTLLRRLPARWRAPAPEAPVPAPNAALPGPREPPEFAWAGESARITGVLYHDAMELVVRQTLASDNPEAALAAWDAARARSLLPFLRDAATAEGAAAADAGPIAERVVEALRNTLEDPDGRWLLMPHPQGAAELALESAPDGALRRQRIDRSFVDADGRRWIIDYKTGSHAGGGLEDFLAAEVARYRDQLLGYATLFREEGREQRLALYMPLLPPGRRLVPVPGPASENTAPDDPP